MLIVFSSFELFSFRKMSWEHEGEHTVTVDSLRTDSGYCDRSSRPFSGFKLGQETENVLPFPWRPADEDVEDDDHPPYRVQLGVRSGQAGRPECWKARTPCCCLLLINYLHCCGVGDNSGNSNKTREL